MRAPTLPKPIADLTTPEAEAELARLAAQIGEHDRLYYQVEAPLISDAAYDALKRRNAEIEAAFPDLIRPDSPSKRVGAAPASTFRPVAHGVPMLSLDNAFSDEEVGEFVERVRRFLNLGGQDVGFTAEPKIDGLSINLRYENGVLALGATRGDGRTGEDVTQNIRTIGDIPHRLKGSGWPELVELRGEIYMPLKAFEELNAKAEAAGERIYANPRNFASGSLRQIDPRVTASRPLRFFAYGWGESSTPFAETQWEALQRFADWGLPVNDRSRRVENLEGLIEAYRRWRRPGRISATTSTGSSTRSTGWTGRGGSASCRARRAGRWRASFRPSRRAPCSKASTSRSGAPAP